MEARTGLNRLVNLIDYYFSMGGMQMQCNVVSRDTLLRAQKDPSKYQNLIVRVVSNITTSVTVKKAIAPLYTSNSTGDLSLPYRINRFVRI